MRGKTIIAKLFWFHEDEASRVRCELPGTQEETYLVAKYLLKVICSPTEILPVFRVSHGPVPRF